MLAAGVKTLVNQIGGWEQGRQLIRASLSDGWSQVTSVGTQIIMSAPQSSGMVKDFFLILLERDLLPNSIRR